MFMKWGTQLIKEINTPQISLSYNVINQISFFLLSFVFCCYIFCLFAYLFFCLFVEIYNGFRRTGKSAFLQLKIATLSHWCWHPTFRYSLYNFTFLYSSYSGTSPFLWEIQHFRAYEPFQYEWERDEQTRGKRHVEG